jgi:Holliday junction resolvasome RuvABC ATP-dependent DNA helicase subunit
MAKGKNLMSADALNNSLTPSERAANARKAGKASGEARRAKKTMREYADFLLSLPVSDRRKWNKLSRAGVPPEGCDNKMLVTFALMQAAQSGDVQAVKELRNLIGEDRDTEVGIEKLDEILKGLDDVMQHD